MSSIDPAVAYCLQRIGRERRTWDTLVVRGSADTRLSAEELWAVWADLAHWPDWSPLHQSVTVTSPAPLSVGSTFDQRISLGFPAGTTTEHVTISLLEPARRAAWAGSGNAVRSCHLWSFTPLPGGGTRVINTELFAGLPAALLRPLAGRRWNRDFQAAVDGLIQRQQQRRARSRSGAGEPLSV